MKRIALALIATAVRYMHQFIRNTDELPR